MSSYFPCRDSILFFFNFIQLGTVRWIPNRLPPTSKTDKSVCVDKMFRLLPCRDRGGCGRETAISASTTYIVEMKQDICEDERRPTRFTCVLVVFVFAPTPTANDRVTGSTTQMLKEGRNCTRNVDDLFYIWNTAQRLQSCGRFVVTGRETTVNIGWQQLWSWKTKQTPLFSGGTATIPSATQPHKSR